jgi:hypothetical protein
VARLDEQLEALGAPEIEEIPDGPKGPPPPGWKSDAENYAALKSWQATMAGIRG